MAGFLAESLNLRRIAVSHDSNEYGTMVAQAFEQGLSARGIVVTGRRLYRDGETDFGRHVRGALADQAQALFIAGYPDEAVHLLRQVRAVTTTLIVAGSDALNSRDVVDGAGASAEGLYVPSGFVADARLPVVRGFVSAYERKYGRPPDQFAAQAYDAVRVVVHAVRRAGTDRGAIRDAIATLKRFPGTTGDLGFDRWGDPARDVVIARVRGGTFAPSQ
jgi:branched-chain amino acid transport system substrate-binding protein